MQPRQLHVLVFVLILSFSAMMAVFGEEYDFFPVGGIQPHVKNSPAVLIGAGDIAVCGREGDQHTAALIERLLNQHPQASIFTAGDNAQIMGELSEFTRCFDRSWGRFKPLIHPSPGNHDWYTEAGAPYFFYFGRAAGRKGLGYYSYNLGGWHIVSLNSNCDRVDCSADSEQLQWLRTDLEKNKDRQCTMIYWHHPLWNSGEVPTMPGIKTFWDIAVDYGAEIVVNGHDHHYERFAPLDRQGQVDETNGTREFIVGTGGAWLFDLGPQQPITDVRDNSTHGVIVFTLYPDQYLWEFVPVDGGTFTDSGTGMCH